MPFPSRRDERIARYQELQRDARLRVAAQKPSGWLGGDPNDPRSPEFTQRNRVTVSKGPCGFTVETIGTPPKK